MALLVHVCLVLTLLSSVCRSMSIQNRNSTSNNSTEERIGNLEKTIKILESRIQSVNETTLKGLVSDSVMFYAIIKTRTFTLSIKSTLVFEDVILIIGGHYNKYDGVFVAPVKGVYLFSWTISIEGGNYAVTELVIENTIISATGDTGSTSGRRAESMTALCRMEKGDHAFIRTTGYGSSNTFYSSSVSYPRTSFLGMLVKND